MLPVGIEVPSAFETVGHIAHLNLREEALPYKQLIGRVILDKNPKLRTVVNKLGNIENEFRVFEMEVLAGEDSTAAVVQQMGHRFHLDFRKVYWNSRLEREHARLVETFDLGHTILDAMAGVGPFAIPAASRGCKVLANDLNPDSYAFLRTNIQLNRVSDRAAAFNMDGGEFIRLVAAGKLPEVAQQQPPFHHVIMNLPATAIEICSAFRGAFPTRLWEPSSLPLVHVYGFVKGEETQHEQGKE